MTIISFNVYYYYFFVVGSLYLIIGDVYKYVYSMYQCHYQLNISTAQREMGILGSPQAAQLSIFFGKINSAAPPEGPF